MKSSLKKSVLLSSSLVLALTVLSSCGKSKDVSSQPPTAQTTPAPTGPTSLPTTPAPTDLPAAPTTPPDNTLTPNGPLTAPNNTLPPGPAPVSPDNTLTPQGSQPSLSGSGQAGEVLPPLPSAPPEALPQPGRGGPAPLNQGNGLRSPEEQIQKQQLRAFQVDFTGQVAVKTGGKSGELLYTSAGDDSLMEEFKSYNAKVSVQQQMMNNNLAKAITNAKLSRSAGEMTVTLNVDEFGTVQTYRLTATSEDDNMKLSLSKQGTTGEMPFEGGFLKCLDVDGGCETAYAKIKFAGGYTRVIFRNAAADTHYLLQEKIVNNSAFSTLSKYILNAVNSANTSEKIDGMKLSSYEIINGRAAMGAMITTEDQQMIALNIPMVVSSINSEVNAAVAKSADLSKSFDFANLSSSYGTSLSQKINAVKITKNNGRGQFKLQLQLGTEGASASIWIVAVSMAKETITLDQIRSFESTLKAF